ncbi:MarR family winged helix-turn-helix transcriptional regulator [Curvivirga aplysinae]|uniref:MarR family winged helix-turn-helix transcriptional regulator n=1 Tax=Curvivirga aplysinae TaxID=2529852 RepID=UPI0012BCB183|nr:MarR family winged helix-turn-helix transcriptional regulator [Curvivirga aplysinae]MTI08999.1 MarR family transcriptional regulator [Curvivirga aplysinae]
MTEAPSFDLQSFFPYRARMFYWAASQAIKDVYAKEFGLSVNEWRTMANLHDFRPLSAKEIVERSSIGKVDVSRAITSLQEKDLLERHIDPTDRRRVLLCLTNKGKKMMNELLPLLREREKEILSGLNQEEYETLLQLMSKVEVSSKEVMGKGL